MKSTVILRLTPAPILLQGDCENRSINPPTARDQDQPYAGGSGRGLPPAAYQPINKDAWLAFGGLIVSNQILRQNLGKQIKKLPVLCRQKILPEGDGKLGLPRYHPTASRRWRDLTGAVLRWIPERHQLARGYGGCRAPHIICYRLGGASHRRWRGRQEPPCPPEADCVWPNPPTYVGGPAHRCCDF